MSSVYTWETAEGGEWIQPQRGSFNPLNATWNYNEKSSCGLGCPIPDYINWRSGIISTAKEIYADFPKIFYDLSVGGNPPLTIGTINSEYSTVPGTHSTWGTADIESVIELSQHPAELCPISRWAFI
jgi:hypothetical protein